MAQRLVFSLDPEQPRETVHALKRGFVVQERTELSGVVGSFSFLLAVLACLPYSSETSSSSAMAVLE